MVVDLPLQGMSFTWSSNREVGAWARLDRFLCAPVFLSWFPNIFQRGLSKSLSEHNPVLLGVSSSDWGPKPFRIQNGWMENRELMSGTRELWKNCKSGGSVSFRLLQKTRVVKNFIRIWARGRKRPADLTKKLEEELSVIEKKAEGVGWSEKLRQDRRDCLVKLWKNIR
jgi:hypothetical protein